MKLLQTADWHVRDADIEETEKCLNFMVETARAEQPDIIINAGDTFDSQNIKMDSLSAKLVFKIVKKLGDIAPVVVIIGTPSHDGSTAEVLRYIKATFPIHVATLPEQLYIAGAHFAGCNVSMCPAPTKRFFNTDSGIENSNAEIAGELSKLFMGFAAEAALDPESPHILVGHWQVDGAMLSDTQALIGTDISISKDQMALAQADVTLLGHIHHAQHMGNNIFYSGSITGLNWGELSDKGFYIHELKDKELIESRFIKTPSKKMIKIVEDLTLDNSLMVGQASASNFTHEELAGAHLKLEIEVYQDEADSIDIKKVKKVHMDLGAEHVDVHLIRVPRDNVRSKAILKLSSLSDKLREMANLREETVSESILDKAYLLESETSQKIILDVQHEGGLT